MIPQWLGASEISRPMFPSTFPLSLSLRQLNFQGCKKANTSSHSRVELLLALELVPVPTRRRRRSWSTSTRPAWQTCPTSSFQQARSYCLSIARRHGEHIALRHTYSLYCMAWGAYSILRQPHAMERVARS